MRFPEFAVIDVLDSLPHAQFAAALLPARTEMPVVEPGHLRREPCRDVNAVCDVTDRHGVFASVRIEARPHRPRYLTVQGGNRIGPPGELQAEHRHAEFFVRSFQDSPGQAHQAVLRQAELVPQAVQMFLDQMPH